MGSLRNLYWCFPHLWQQLRQMEADQGRPYLPSHTVAELEAKFQMERDKGKYLVNEQGAFRIIKNVPMFEVSKSTPGAIRRNKNFYIPANEYFGYDITAPNGAA